MIVLAMDYENAYSKEISRKITMQDDALREVNAKADKNKDEILKLHYKINIITLINILIAIMILPQASPYFVTLLHTLYLTLF